MKPQIASIVFLAASFLTGTAAMAQRYPPTCSAASAFHITTATGGGFTPITSYIGNSFSVGGLAPGQYSVKTNMPMMMGGMNSSTVGSDGILKGSITCQGVQNFSFVQATPVVIAPAPVPECLVANVGTKCNWYTIFEPNYYPNTFKSSYHATNPASYTPVIPRCTQPAPSTAPATTINTGHMAPRCMRKFTFVRATGPNAYDAQLQNGTAVELFPPN